MSRTSRRPPWPVGRPGGHGVVLAIVHAQHGARLPPWTTARSGASYTGRPGGPGRARWAVIRNPSAVDRYVQQLYENEHRQDYSDVERAFAYERHKEMLGLTWDELAGKLGLSKSRIHQIRWTKSWLAPSVQRDITGGRLTGKHRLLPHAAARARPGGGRRGGQARQPDAPADAAGRATRACAAGGGTGRRRREGTGLARCRRGRRGGRGHLAAAGEGAAGRLDRTCRRGWRGAAGREETGRPAGTYNRLYRRGRRAGR
jgi:hypothetical protein